MDVFISFLFWFSRITSLAKLFFKFSHKYNIHIRDLRNLEKQSLKIAHLRCDISFLTKCKQNGLFPKFLNFTDKNRLFRYEQINDAKYQKLNSILKTKNQKIKRLLKLRTSNIFNLKNRIGIFDFLIFCKIMNRTIISQMNKIKTIQNKKFQNLWIEQKICTPENTVLNFSSFQLDDKSLDVLKQGLKAPILPRNDINIPMQVQIERLLYILGTSVHKNHCKDISHSLHDFHKQIIQKNNKTLQKQFRSTIKDLKKRSEIKICRFDKGQGIAVLNSEDYMKKLQNIIDDKSKFIEVPQDESDLKCHHTIVKDNSRMADILKKEVKPFIDDLTFSKINKRGGQPAKLYGVAKVHKDNIPLRPIIASYDTSTYELGKYLNKFITPIIPTRFSVQRNSDLLTNLRNYTYTNNSVLVSFDVESLFTNVPLDETIEIAANLVYDRSSNLPPFPKHTFIKLLKIATSNLFLFNDKLYRQKDGLAMGSPLAPTLSNLFMGVLENRHLNNRKSSCVKFYKRFVDDCLILFEDINDVDRFFNYANTWHPNIKFTKEIGYKNLPFLDINIDISNNILITDVYRKPTYTSLILNYKSLCPVQWKTALFHTLIHRADLICSSWEIFHKEIERLTNIFSKNGYPFSFIHKQVRKFLEFKFSDCPSPINTDQYLSSHVIKIPYIGTPSIIFKKRLKQQFRKISNTFTISCSFFTNKLGSCFSLKDKTPLSLRAGVIYKFTCEVDPHFSYIGKTIRHLGIRINEHKKRLSAIYDHRLGCSCNCDSDNFEILGSDNNDFSLKIMEAIYIKKLNPSLNKQLTGDGAFFAVKLC